jgi:hypothetical protein|tara:strand:- start:312 stop:629 length:318 start_codon:yes stop_codon:yes gene_type:complete
MLKTVDIAHAGQSSSEAIILLEVAISTAKEEGAVAVKIIHGLGSGSIVEKVRSWAKEQEGRFKAVIPGENYNAFNKDAVDMRSELSNKQDRDFNNRNSGVTIFWL